MKITVDQASLLREISALQGVIEKKSTIPILGNVLMTATENGRLTIMATDLEVGFRSEIEANVVTAGRATVAARRLNEILRRLPAGSVSFRLDAGSLHIECERIKYRLSTQDADQFPSLRAREGSPDAVIASEHLANMIKMVFFATTMDDPRYTLGGSLWEFSDDQLTMVATDGHRLSVATRPAQRVGKDVSNILVPRTALREVQKLADEHDGDVFLWVGTGHLIALIGQREISTTLQENQKFPDYRRVIPAANDKIIEIETPTLRGAIDRVAVLRDDDTKLIRVDLGDGLLRLSSSNAKLGEAQEDVAVSYEGAELKIGFNAQYLLDFLGVVGTEKVRLSLGESMGQGLLEPSRPEDDPRVDRYVVMPMAI